MDYEPSTFVPTFHKGTRDNYGKSVGIHYTKLGETKLVVSNMSLGGSSFGNIYSDMTQEDVNDIVLNAVMSGINYIDTAPWYGQGQSEARLGVALRNIPRTTFYVATKVGRYELEVDKMFDFSVKTITSKFEESLKKLQLDYVDVLQIHDVEFCKSLDQILKVNCCCIDTFISRIVWPRYK